MSAMQRKIRGRKNTGVKKEEEKILVISIIGAKTPGP